MTRLLTILLFAFSVAGAYVWKESQITCRNLNNDNVESNAVQNKRCWRQYNLHAYFLADMMKLMNNYNFTEYSDEALRNIPVNVKIQPEVGVESAKFKGFGEFKAWLQKFRTENKVEYFVPSEPRGYSTLDWQGVSSKWTAVSSRGKIEGIFFLKNNEQRELAELVMRINKNDEGDAQEVRDNFYKCNSKSDCADQIRTVEKVMEEFHHFDQNRDELVQWLNDTYFDTPTRKYPQPPMSIHELMKHDEFILFKTAVLLRPGIAAWTDLRMKWPLVVRIQDRDVFGSIQTQFNNRKNEDRPSLMSLSLSDDVFYDF